MMPILLGLLQIATRPAAAGSATPMTCRKVLGLLEAGVSEAEVFRMVRDGGAPFTPADMRCFAGPNVALQIRQQAELYQLRALPPRQGSDGVYLLEESDAGRGSRASKVAVLVAGEALRLSGSSGPLVTLHKHASGVRWQDAAPWSQDEYALWLNLAVEGAALEADQGLGFAQGALTGSEEARARAAARFDAVLYTEVSGSETLRVRWWVRPLRAGVSPAEGELRFRAAAPQARRVPAAAEKRPDRGDEDAPRRAEPPPPPAAPVARADPAKTRAPIDWYVASVAGNVRIDVAGALLTGGTQVMAFAEDSTEVPFQPTFAEAGTTSWWSLRPGLGARAGPLWGRVFVGAGAGAGVRTEVVRDGDVYWITPRATLTAGASLGFVVPMSPVAPVLAWQVATSTHGYDGATRVGAVSWTTPHLTTGLEAGVLIGDADEAAFSILAFHSFNPEVVETSLQIGLLAGSW